ncbi:hypothetical protein ACEQ8H_008495 [Pleosporales sp. CAS-2024a]
MLSPCSNSGTRRPDWNNPTQTFEESFNKTIAANRRVHDALDLEAFEAATPPAASPPVVVSPPYCSRLLSRDQTLDNPSPVTASASPSTSLGTPPPATASASKPPLPRTKDAVVLEAGFEWDRESLALLFRWKGTNKKGFAKIVESGKFPGMTVTDLQKVWNETRDEAERYYRDIYGK